MATCILTALSQVVFQIVLVALPPYGEMLKNCEFLEQLLRHIGFVRFNQMSPISAITWASPEIIMLVGSICIHFACKKFSAEPDETEAEMLVAKTKPKKQLLRVTVAIGKYIVLSAFCFAAILRPSVPGGVYFLIFLGGTTWWAFRSLNRIFGYFLRCLVVFIFLHIVVLYAYQMQWPQTLLPKDDPYARYFGLTQLMNVNCTDPRDFLWSTTEEWASFLNPIVLLWLYYFVVLESSLLLKAETQKKQGTFSRLESNINGPLTRQLSHRLSTRRLARSRTMRRRWQSATRKVRLISGTSPSKRYGSGGRKPVTILQDSTGSVVVTETYDEIPLEQLGKDDDSQEEKPSLFDTIIYGIENAVGLIIRSSYIFTNIIMMTWSITFLCWLTFVLLLVANILWMIPNQRRAMLHFSPFLVLYACFLLISGYIYSMNLTDEELPQIVSDIDLGFIGFMKIKDLPCKFLFIKCLFTCMFWITLKQFSTERKEAQQTHALADMVSPLQVTVGTAAGVPQEEAKSSPTFEKIEHHVKMFLTQFWIWIVAITLFSVAITGERMTVFRIIYMALFIFFILSFQLSYTVWRKLLLPFWVTVILYSMSMLILVYTYQFKNIRGYWLTVFHVSLQQQLDIGLEAYEPKQLFVRLATPTFFVIITAIQINCFQKDYLKLSEPRVIEMVDEPMSDTTSIPDIGAAEPSSIKTDVSVKQTATNIGSISTAQVQMNLIKWWKNFEQFMDLFFVFLEIHLPTIVMLICIFMCIFDHCAVYLPIIVLIIISFFMGRKVMIAVIYTCSVLTSIFLLLRMLYQIDYINHTIWNVDCERLNVTLNNAEWLGFTKATGKKSLYSIVSWNIAYIIAVTVMSFINVRQLSFKGTSSTHTRRVFFVFPEITRKDADKNLKSCLKYLLNFGFYKFGIEITLIVIVSLIGFRFDVYSMMYALWLLVLISFSRRVLAKIWNVFYVFVGVSIIFQYVMITGLPPYYCNLIEFAWEVNKYLSNITQLTFLLSFDKTLPVENVLFEFVLFLFVSRQSIVFRTEASNDGRNYAGGSNEPIVEQGEDPDFVIPVPDFVTYCRSYLDLVKRAVFMNWIWFTLAAMFLAGTQRVSLFSAGYLIGAFVFLWQGSDIYLRPMPKIMRNWNRLLLYNVLVIICKSFLQVVGCIFIEYLSKNACWVIHLFSVGCLKPSGNTEKGIGSADECQINEYVGLAWDGVCFAFLIFQCRIFRSYYFFHVVNETKATTILASRGADLIEELRRQRILKKSEGERKILEKIKIKMERIKAGQKKLRGPAFDTNNHFVDGIFPGRPRHRVISPDSHTTAIRSGDYYMFDEIEDDELDLIQETRQMTAEEEEEELAMLGHKHVLGDLLHTVLRTDIPTAIRTETDLHRRRSSMPLSRQRSSVSDRTQLSVPHSAPPTSRVVIIDPEEKKSPEPKPGTSKDDDDDELSDISEPQELTTCDKILNYLYFIWLFFESGCLTLALFLNKYSKDYRYVLKVLNREKKLLKENTRYYVGLRLGKGRVWKPSGSYYSLVKDSKAQETKRSKESLDDKPAVSEEESDINAQATSSMAHSSQLDRQRENNLTVPEIRILAPSLERGLDSPFLGSLGDVKQLIETFEEGEMSVVDQPPVFKLLLSLWYVIVSHSHIMCYFMIFLNQIQTATFLSLPLPLFVLFWGTLTIPRPTKTFWVTIIAYTEIIVLIKCMFQFEIIAWNKNQNLSPLFPPRIIGIEKTNNYALWDLLVLLMVFFHRFLMKSLGLWKSTYTPAIAMPDGEYKITGDTLSALTDDPSHFTLPKTVNFGELEDLHEETDEASTSGGTSQSKSVNIRATEVPPFSNFLPTVQMRFQRYGSSIHRFFKDLLDPSSRIATDVYSYMFLCDFFNFFVILIGYSSFGAYVGGEGVSDYLQENKVPVLFLLMLILQFVLIIIDRAIFLRKYIFGKMIFQFLQIVFLHVWLFMIYPWITDRGYNYFNLFLFKGFLAIPFLFELRTVMDWMWTDTSMTMFDWMKMEDVFAHIFQIKCYRYCEKEYPQPRGEKKPTLIKYFMGGACLAAIIAIIWFPLVFFALLDAVGHPNPPTSANLELTIGPYEPIYQISVQRSSIYRFDEIDYNRMHGVYAEDKGALTFLTNYQASDIVAMKFSVNSASVWSISPPDRKRMIDELNSTAPLTITMRYTIFHKSNTKEDSGSIQESVYVPLDDLSENTNQTRQKVLEMLVGDNKDSYAFINHVFPKFVKITNKGTAKPVSQFMKPTQSTDDTTLRNVKISRQSSTSAGGQLLSEWWRMEETCDDDNYFNYLMKIPYADCTSVIMYGFSEKLFPSTLNFITASGIIGVYTTIVFVAGRLLRSIIAGVAFKIMFEDLPNVDRILQLCFDIYLVRESREFVLEEDLFAKLIFLFRSPETLIKWTRPKEEVDDDEEEEEGDEDNDDSSRK
ncbi:hypothetical protein FQR65_LT02631 [Abscondita terminalis]|nr:hypothetical protein FQR65_LT02631 [Abscondita terminalis]